MEARYMKKKAKIQKVPKKDLRKIKGGHELTLYPERPEDLSFRLRNKKK